MRLSRMVLCLGVPCRYCSAMTDIDLLAQAADLATRAAAIIMQIRARGFQTAGHPETEPGAEQLLRLVV